MASRFWTPSKQGEKINVQITIALRILNTIQGSDDNDINHPTKVEGLAHLQLLGHES